MRCCAALPAHIANFAFDPALLVEVCQVLKCVSCDTGPDLKRPDVLKVVDTLGKIFRLLERLAERERELQLWARAENGGKQACTVIAGVLFHSLDIVHASVLVTPQTQRVRLAEGISQQLTRIEHGLGEVLSSMPEDELLMLTKLLLEIEHFELVRAPTSFVSQCERDSTLCFVVLMIIWAARDAVLHNAWMVPGGTGDCNRVGLDISACECAGQSLGTLPLRPFWDFQPVAKTDSHTYAHGAPWWTRGRGGYRYHRGCS